MNLRRCCILILTLAFSGSLAVLAAEIGNPYQAIVTRNMFGLVPIPTGPPPNATPDVALPKITPNGIMTLFGKLQVLFKVSKPGQAAGKEDSYVMSEGDRQDDIEVEKIDEPSATITFNNHGTIQELALVPGKATGGGAVPALPGMPGHPPGLVPRIGLPSGGAAPGVAFGQRSSVHNGSVNPGAANPMAGGLPGSGMSSSSNGSKTQAPLTPEEQVIMIEANRMVTQDAVNQGEMPPLPPTVMTPADATGIGGGPLVAPPPSPPGSGQ